MDDDDANTEEAIEVKRLGMPPKQYDRNKRLSAITERTNETTSHYSRAIVDGEPNQNSRENSLARTPQLGLSLTEEQMDPTFGQ